jgi:glycosyltransferase involved in cell wall biosynthesis
VHFHYWGDCDDWWYDIFFRAVRTLGCRVIENVNTPVDPYQADFVDRYVYVSNYVQSNFGDENTSRNLTIHPGSDFSLFSRRGNRQLPSDCIGMVYRLENDKLNEQSIDALIKVAQRRPQTKVIIVGGGTLLEPYRRAAKEAGVERNFVFTGYVDYTKLPEFYEQMTLFVAPVWKESFGQVSSFAMSMGIPVVGYSVGGLAEIVDDTSLLAEAGNSDELATLVIELLDDPERCRRIGARGRDRAIALFSVEAMLDAYRSVYGELLGVPA